MTLEGLCATYPDAWVVQTHRDPVQTIPSFSSLVLTIRQSNSDEVDVHEVGEQVDAQRPAGPEVPEDPEHVRDAGEHGAAPGDRARSRDEPDPGSA